jgi:CRISPR/Cas system-associated endoribonuclease Cas2
MAVESIYGDKNMKAYLISYDLDKPGQDYSNLIAKIEGLGGVKILYSEWVLKSESSAKDLRDYLKRFIDSNDKLLVVALTGEAAWSSLMISGDRFKELIAA